MSSIIEYQVLKQVSHDNQLYPVGSLIPLQAKDVPELLSLGIIKLPGDDGDQFPSAVAARALDSQVAVNANAEAQLALLTAQLGAALADKDAALGDLRAAQQSLQLAQANLAAAVGVEADLKSANLALTDQVAQLQQQLDAANAAAQVAAATGAADTPAGDQANADAAAGGDTTANAKASKSAKAS